MKKKIYVNVYLVNLAYGGPEEGGWYYDEGKPIHSLPAKNIRRALRTKSRLARRFDNLRPLQRRSNVNGGPDLEIFLEDHPARYFPERRPRYE